MSSSEYNILTEIHLVNGSGYNNGTYGVVDGVIYVTTGEINFSYSGNIYLCNKQFEFGRIENIVDFIGDLGGYKPFNQYSFTIKDKGMLEELLGEGINFLNAQVIVRIEFDGVVYDAYYGAIQEPSTIGDELRIVCGDIASVKESNAPKKIILGEWDKSTTTRNVDLEELESEISNNEYAIIFCSATGDPGNNTKADYEADETAYTSRVESTGFNKAPTSSYNRYFVNVYCETAAFIGLNPNFASTAEYQNYFENYNLEVLDEDGNASAVLNIYQVKYDTANNDRMRVEVYTESGGVEVAKGKVRFSKARVTLNYSDKELNSIPTLEGEQQISNLIDADLNKVNSGSYFKKIGQEVEFGSDNGKIPAKIHIPKLVRTSILENSSWEYFTNNLILTLQNQKFNVTGQADNNNYLGSVTKESTDNSTTSLFVTCRIAKDDIPDGDWDVGFNLLMKHDFQLGLNGRIGFADGYPIILTTKTELNENNSRVIETETINANAVFGENVFRVDIGTERNSFIGKSAIPLDNIETDSGSYLIVNATYGRNSEQLPVSINRSYVDGDLLVEIAFTIYNSDTAGSGTAYIYMPTFFFYQKNFEDLTANVDIENTEGVSWSTDPKYTSGAIGDYPLTRTEVARYLLDVYGNHAVTDYLNDIFLPISEDKFTIAYTTFDKLEQNVTSLIDNILNDSTFVLVGNNLGKRKMINIHDLLLGPGTTEKTIQGSVEEVEVRGYYQEIKNSYSVTFDGDLKYRIVYDKDSGSVESSGNVDYDQTSDSTLVDLLNGSIYFNSDTDVLKLEYENTNFGEVSLVPQEVALVADIIAWDHKKYKVTREIKSQFVQPVYIGSWIDFVDLRYTGNKQIKGLVQGVTIDFQAGTVIYYCVGISTTPPAVVLDEQIGGNLLEEQTGGDVLDEL